ncbi:hypothetical protein M3_0091 [Lysinibacillus phage vB_LfM_LysYB1]|nr:hypothetical protein M3_0091 [Lysinibacillus phage vB_LfM_LysYB1]WAB25400.1 hypothetical protein M5_0222 [Lysinibacillus phage vB_LfM_LysYB2]
MSEELKIALQEKMLKSIRVVIASGVIEADYFDKLGEELENAGFDTELFNVRDLFEKALMKERVREV